MEREMEEVNKYGKMEMYMKGIGKMIKSTNMGVL